MVIRNIDKYYIFFLILVFICLLFGLGSYGLAETSEARYAEISREMLLSGDYLNPELLGIFHFHKPPITYYITTLGYRIFGINEFGARFFLQISIIVQLVLVYGISNLLYKNRKISFLAGLIYFSMPIVLISSRNLTTDNYLTTFILGAIYCWQYYVTYAKIWVLYLFYTLVGLALLTKGPVALLFIIVYIVTEKTLFNRAFKVGVHHILGILVCLTISASWYLMVIIENPKLWDYFIQKQLASRMNADSFNRAKPVWYYALLLIGLIFPWWISLIPRFKSKIKSFQNLPRESLLLIYSSVTLFVIFSAFTTKLIFYLLPMFWMMAVFIAVQLPKIEALSRKYINITYLIIISLLCSAVIIFWILDFSLIKSTFFASLIALGIFIFSLLTYYLLDNSKSYKPAIMAAVFGACLVLLSSVIFRVNSTVINSTRDIVNFINHVSPGLNKTIIVDDHLLPSLSFYTRAPIITLKDERNTTNRETQFENDNNWKKTLWDLNDSNSITKLDSLSRKPNDFLLISKKQGVQPQLNFLKTRYNSKKEYPKWNLFYNK